LRPAIIEKDYYVTEALRIIAAAAPDKIIFKGGSQLRCPLSGTYVALPKTAPVFRAVSP
jgi:hypothetical protein